MQIIADTHSHTVACDHAFSTVAENAATARERGLRFLCMTEHGSAMAGSPSKHYFGAMHTVVPPMIGGVVILKGAELNILDDEGRFDLTDALIQKMDWVIASMHSEEYPPAARDNHTRAWLAVAENPLVDVIGHCGDGRYPFDEEVVLPSFRLHNKIVEINNHSFGSPRNAGENCERIAKKCMALGIPIVVSSDAHFHEMVGRFPAALAMLERIGFPEELILNADYGRFLAVVKEKAGHKMKAFFDTI
jgi:putative hydrolase